MSEGRGEDNRVKERKKETEREKEGVRGEGVKEKMRREGKKGRGERR